MSDLAPSVLARLFDELPIGIHVYRIEDPSDDRTFRLMAANVASCRILGAPGEVVTGRLIDEIFPDAGGAIRRALAGVVRSAAGVSFEGARPRGEPGGAASLSFTGFPLPDGCVGLLIEDIGRHGREAAQLRERLTFVDAVIQHLPLPVFVKEAQELRYLEMNQSGSDLCGIPREAFLGRTDHECLPPELARRLEEVDRRVFAGRQVLDLPDELVPGRAGDVRTLRTLKVPIYDDDGEPKFLIGISEDVTERRRAEEALRQSERELRDAEERLRETIRQLLTPVLPIDDGILVVPLVGHVDSQRSEQFTGALLSSIEQHRAETVIIDITGVPIVDTAVVDHLLRAIRAAELLGAHCIVVGISPRFARTVADLGIDLGSVVIRRNLQAGVAYALARRGRQTERAADAGKGPRPGARGPRAA
ncbi:PAS domain-containing protein [Sorangium sp. So ce134]